MPYSSLRRQQRIEELGELIEAYMELAWSFALVSNAAEFTHWRDEAYAVMRERDAMALSRTPEEVAALERARGLC